MARERSAGAVIYRITSDGNILYLLLQAAPGKPWGFAKGKAESGETDEEAARREIREEAGLDEVEIDPGFLHSVHYVFRRGRTVINKDVIYFLARTYTDQINISWEHVAYRWAPFKDALHLVFYENARETLQRAHDYLIKKLGVKEE